jgi:hypothetical protein
MSYAQFVTEAGDQFLAAMADGQDAYLRSVNAYKSMIPAAPMSPMSPMFVPPALAGTLPTPEELTRVSFGFAEKLLQQQRDFTQKLMATMNAAASAPPQGTPSSNDQQGNVS